MRRLVVAAVLVVAALHPAAAHAALTVLDVDTGKRTTLVAREPSEGWTSLRWTADGSALIGVANQELDLSVRRYPVDGGHARLVRKLPEAIDAVLNRDGTNVAALYDHGLDGTGGVIVRDVASGRPHAKLPQSAEGDELYENALELTWSPDGRRVAYHAYERSGETVRIANARTGRVLRRLKAAGGIYLVDFSPAGDRVLYTSGTFSTLNVLDISSGASRRIAATAVTAAWAPAGERIAASTAKS
jgi:WD40 repeat protein